MDTSKKIIKILAIIFAVGIILGIISLIYGIGTIFLIGVGGEKEELLEEITELTDINFENVDKIDFDISYANVKIKTGDDFKVRTNIKNLNVKIDEEKFKIKDKKVKFQFGWFTEEKSKKREIEIILPEEKILEETKLKFGVGNIEIEELNTKILTLEVGTADSKIKNLNVLEKGKIKLGVGSLRIEDGEAKNLDVETGTGECRAALKLIGINNFKTGIGSINLTLIGNKDEYKLDLEKGIGEIKVDGKNIESKEKIGEGENEIIIKSGIGETIINFK